MNNNKKLKAIALSLGLAALMVPATLDAQINRGLLQNPYKDHDNSRRNESMMRAGDPNSTLKAASPTPALDNNQPHWAAASSS